MNITAQAREMTRKHVAEEWSPEGAAFMLAHPEELAPMVRIFERELRRGMPVTGSSGRRSYSPRRPDAVPSSGFYLYRLWAADDRLLYVGVSTNLSARLRVHRARWGDLIDHVTWEEQPDERTMLAAERQAITNEDPAFNRAAIG
jgi:hypothetical protein